MTAPLSSAPQIRHHLAAAIRFEDVFTGQPTEGELDVRVDTLPVVANMPRQPWQASRASDGTYRFFVSQNTAMPVGPLTVTVTAPNREYENYQPFVLTLPLPWAGPFPARSDFVVRRGIWPTRQLRLQPGETGVTGRVVDATGTPVPGLRVRMAEAPAPIAAAVPATYTASDGSFLVRLPGLRSMTGSPPVAAPRTTASLVIELLTSAMVVVNPTSPPFPVTTTIGRVSTLLITVP